MDGPVFNRARTGAVALTFDDGPSEWTHLVLDELARAAVAATFFVMPGTGTDLLLTMVEDGHEVGYHCSEHIRHSKRSREAVEAEASADLRSLADLGIAVSAWRPPWGDLAPWTTGLAIELGLDVWLWSDDTHDWDGRDHEVMLSELHGTLEGGAVVLMHDGIGPGALRTDPLETVALIAPLVRLCRERGLEPGRLTAREAVDA